MPSSCLHYFVECAVRYVEKNAGALLSWRSLVEWSWEKDGISLEIGRGLGYFLIVSVLESLRVECHLTMDMLSQVVWRCCIVDRVSRSRVRSWKRLFLL